MWKNERYNLEGIGVEGSYYLNQIDKISHSRLSLFEEPSLVKSNLGVHRCQIFFSNQVGNGSYGNLHLAMRTTPNGGNSEVVCKQPKMKEMNQIPEAILQYISHCTLKTHGIPWAVPCVYDLFLRKQETWFSMEHVRGTNLLSWIQNSSQPDHDILLLIFQVGLILLILQEDCGLDHRDLKIDNLMIREEECLIHTKISGKTWKLKTSFQVVILDFGFACLGSFPLGSDAVLNLGEVLPPMDPCPKEGRDMFHFLVSMMSLECIREKMSVSLMENIDEWLHVKGKNFGSFARKWGQEWVHLVTSQRDFRASNCSTLHLLEKCAQLIQNEISSPRK
jgi:serine/threonine protein kinase